MAIVLGDVTMGLEITSQTLTTFGKRGSGKTHTATVMVEQMLDAGIPLVVVDPNGVFWGLRQAADGTENRP